MLYRFISIETFLDIIINQHLVLVHPSLWEDPFEYEMLEKYWQTNDKSSTEVILRFLASKNMFGQSWTDLKESDALWRIYSHNKSSIRIAVKIENLKKLENITLNRVTYKENIDFSILKTSYDVFTTKRTAFEHENEVRLYQFLNRPKSPEEFEHARIDLDKFYNPESYQIYFDGQSKEDYGPILEKIVSKYNLNIDKKTESISFTHIDNFIDSIMLNPFAPNWFNDTLSQLCKNYSINYLGKSKLYNKSK